MTFDRRLANITSPVELHNAPPPKICIKSPA